MRKIIQITAFILFVAVLAGLMGFIYLERERQVLNEIHVSIFKDGEKGFLDEQELYTLVESADSIRSRPIGEIDTRYLEQLVGRQPWTAKVDVFVNVNRELMVNVSEKVPLLRVFNKAGKSFYVDEKGGIIPLSDHYTPWVPVANGYIDVVPPRETNTVFDSVYANTVLPDLFTLTKLIRSSSFLHAMISQIYVNSKGEFDLIPELGNQIIVLGGMENAGSKLNKLEIFYTQALARAGWKEYKTINLKYKNQVVCTR